jgi:ATP synthase protein I
MEVAVAGSNGPDETGRSGSGDQGGNPHGDDLDRRRRALEAAIAARRPVPAKDANGPNTGGLTGIGYALRLSSEFIAGIVVGAGIGWFIDRFAGTSPWGLIVFLLLGFVAGILNILRSAGLVAEHRIRKQDAGGPKPE